MPVLVKRNKEHGFLLISILFMMVLLAVTAIILNRRAGLQARMASNQINSIQISLGQEATTQDAVWRLTKDPMWRTDAGGENYAYAGTTYNRKVLSATVLGYTDAVVVSVTAQGAAYSASTAFRYHLKDIFFISNPQQISIDTWNNIYIADANNHSIYKVDRVTGVVTRVAGNGIACDRLINPDCGDGGPATDAELNNPYGVWVDATGLIYIADRDNHCIRMVNLAGSISTVAGIGTQNGYSGDDGPAADAELNEPVAVFGDNVGNIYIADRANHIIRKVDSAGIITKIAGIPGSAGYSGDGGLATSAKLDDPSGLFVTSMGALYVADRDNCRIRKFTEGGNITRIAGLDLPGPSCDFSGDGSAATSAELNSPRGVYVDENSGYIYIGDSGNHRVRRFTEGGNITTFAGTGTAGYDPDDDGGPATDAELDTPRGLFMKSSAELVIADTMNSCLREVASGNISTLTAKGDPGFSHPEHIALDNSGNVYIADKNNHRIRKLDPAGKVTTVAGTGVAGRAGDGGDPTSAELNTPKGVWVDGSDNIYIADTENCRIRMVDTTDPEDITITRVAGKGGDPKCLYSGDGGTARSAEINKPHAVFVDASDNLYIADTDNHRIRKVNGSTQIISTVAGNGTACDRLINPDCGDGGPATAAELNKPKGVAVDSSENIYIADTNNHAVRMVNSAGISTMAGNGTACDRQINPDCGDGGAATSAWLNHPVDVFVDDNGNLFIVDHDNHAIRVVSVHDDKIYTLAGTCTSGYNGGDQPAVEAQLNKPTGLAMAATRGGVKINLSDRDNNRIRTLRFKLEKGLY